MLILGDRSAPHRPETLAQRAVAGGVDAVQVRLPGAAPDTVSHLAETVQAGIAGKAALLLNGLEAADDAAALGAGVHLPEPAGERAIAVARAILGPAPLIGRSVHSVAAARESNGADYLLAGHVFPTASHPGEPPLGLAGLAAIVAAASSPVLAIGGITSGNLAAVLRAGATGVAVIGAIATASNPEQAAQELRRAIDTAGEERMTTQLEPGTPPAALNLTVNGRPSEASPGWTVHDFLASKRLSDGMALVELNGAILARAAYGETALRDGDRLEVVHAVGGG